MKKVILITIILAVLTVGGIAIAQGISRNPATVIPSGRTVIVPDQATDNSPVLEKVIFIHYRKDFAKPDTSCGNGICEPGENQKRCPQDCTGNGGGEEKMPKCYGFLAKGAKLKSVKDLTIHPDLETSVIIDSATEWGSHTLTTLFGSYTTDSTANWDGEVADGRNELSFGDYPKSGVIAVTVAWGYFSGPPQTREIVEFDILFDTDFTWGDATVNPMVMDLQNIATHEIGHGVGLGDIYEGACSEVTMYGYSDEGEINKRTLEQPDITGLQELYGA